ncbi:hypothetical protein SADUNF_Sadunf10G0078400 [Salix dunnii]|uniref:Thioredoxin domain-containing protein n=1 Tax=Salix dunnii TaxID=1413687 RepID=A0A835JPB9_9ROSI|nr:hypothetical protein SADUNF_Sadunf10G0078400 [Salix dunnii]
MSLSEACVILSVIVLLLISSKEAASFQSGSRSILRALSGENKALVDYAVDLNSTNFDSVLRDTPATHAIVEFFANWCPACRNYKPHYEKVARLFNGPDAVHPGIVLMTRVDCALKSQVIYRGGLLTSPSLTSLAVQINNKLCDKFSVSHYPMLFWGPPSKFASHGWEPKKEKSEILMIDDGRTAERLVSWINKHLGSSYGLDDEKFENEHLHSNLSDPGQIARAVYDVEEATAIAVEIILEHKMIKQHTRVSLIKFLQLLAVHHPSKRCRKGIAEVLVNFDDLCPPDMWSPDKQEVLSNGKGMLGNFQVCGKEVPRGYWVAVTGSSNMFNYVLLLDTSHFARLILKSPCVFFLRCFAVAARMIPGASEKLYIVLQMQKSFPSTDKHLFTLSSEIANLNCGLWALLHSLSVRIEDGESQFAFRALIYAVPICSVTVPFNTSRDFALWLWNTHNKVNERLMKKEASLGTGDPKFPKVIWPPKQLCSLCYLSHSGRENGFSQIDWDMNEVYKFLTDYYGKTLASLYKEKGRLGDEVTDGTIVDLVASTNAVVVPAGAALAIALASCAFGALACYWRSHQKNRKPRRSWN